MDRNPKANIYEMIREYGIVQHKKRQEFVVELVEGLIKSRSVIFSEIADKIRTDIKTESVERRIQDFFQKVSINYHSLALFLLSFIHHDRLTLSIDRTEWDYGKTQINFLCIAVCIGKMGVPLYFEILDNKSGNSNSEDRKELLSKLITAIGKERISLIVMDREFIGHQWLLWLKEEQIDFCVRVPKHHKIMNESGHVLSAQELLKEKKHVLKEAVIVDRASVNLSLSYDHNGDLLYLIGTIASKKLKQYYKSRWTIEVFFQSLKGRGFNLEKSCLRDLAKYKKLFAIVCIAYTLCWMTGIENGRKDPVKVKKHGYPQYSVFRRGLNFLREFFRSFDHVHLDKLENIVNKIYRRSLFILKTVG